MRIGLWALAITAALLWGGGQGLYTALSNRTPARVSCAVLLKEKPKADWLALEGCVLDAGNSGRTKSDSDPEVFIALVAPGAAADAPVRIVLASKQPATVAFATRTPTRAADLTMVRNVEGLAQFGIDLKDSRKKAIAGVIEHLDPDFIILREGEKPNVALSGAMFVGGLLLLGYVLRRFLARPAA